MADLAYADPEVGQTMRTIENAVGIVQLRLCQNEWANEQGRKMAKGATTRELLAFIASAAVTLREQVAE